MRKIPSTMASQHPDHAGKPYWNDTEFISTREESKETFLNYSELGIPEYKWDWEGKYVDEAVIERLYSDHFDFFKDKPLGKDTFLTFRLPNPKVETEFRMGRAFTGILGANALSEQVGLHTPSLFEVILPMTETAEEMISIQQAFAEIAGLKHQLFRYSDKNIKQIEVIPLFEQVDTIAHSDKILDAYIDLYKTEFGSTPEYLRPYVARSDPALNSGLIPTVLAIKIALSHYRSYETKTGIKLFPIIGSASLPFRGGLTPLNVDQFVNEYKGVRTALIQSAFRYDYEKQDVINAIKQLDEKLPLHQAVMITETDEQKLLEIIKIFEKYYQQSVEKIAPIINSVASQLPKRRERVQHVGLFGYSRGVGDVKLPRAIGFTAALYSVGIPPELLGTGRGLRYARETDSLELIEKYYINIKTDLARAGKYLQKDVPSLLATTSSDWNGIMEDVKEIETYLGHELGPQTTEEKYHGLHSQEIYKKLTEDKPVTDKITEAAILRKSLG